MTSFRAFDENETITTEDEETISFRAKTKTNDVRKDNLKIIKKKKEKDNIKIITKKK